MIPIPSRTLVRAVLVLAASSLGLVLFPRAWALLVALDILLVGAALLDWLLTPGVKKLDASRIAPERMFVLKDQTVVIVVHNRSRLALYVRVRDGVPATLRTGDGETSGRVAPRAEARWEYEVRPRARGLFPWGKIHLRYGSVLGLWEREKTIATGDVVRVYPNLPALSRYHLLARANRLDMLGIRSIRLGGGAWDLESLRDYARGDDIRMIDWKATARRAKLIVRNKQAERNQTVILLVDCGRLMQAQVDGTAKLDHAINTGLLLAHVALSRGDRVGLCAFSHKVHSWVAPRPHLAHMRLITEALFDLRGNFTESDHGRCLRALATRMRKRALVVVLTDFVDAQTSADMIAHLQRASRRHLVLFAALKDPFLEQAARVHPQSTLEGFRKAAAVDLLRERREVLERLRRLGAHVLDAEPGAITPPLINSYLEIALRGLL